MGGRRCVITGAQRYHDRMFCSSGFRECIDEGASDDKKQSQISEPATETLYASLVCVRNNRSSAYFHDSLHEMHNGM